MSEPYAKHGSGIGGCLVIFAIISGLFIFSPGLLLIAYWRHAAHAAWDTGQVWTFGISISLLIWIAAMLTFRKFRAGTLTYLGVCFLAAWALGFACFGLKMDFAREAAPIFFPPSGDAAITNRAHNLHVSASFANTPVDLALEYLYQASRRSDPDGVGVRVIYASRFHTPPPRITYRFENRPLWNVVDEICVMSSPHMQYKVTPDAILCHPATETID